MPIIFTCPACRHRVKVSRRFAGVTRDCPACREAVRVPDLESKTTAEVSAFGSEDDLQALAPAATETQLGATPATTNAPLSLEDATFLAVARAVGFPDEAKIAHFQRVQTEREHLGKSWSLLRLMCANDAITSEQEEHFERIAGLLAESRGQTPVSPTEAIKMLTDPLQTQLAGAASKFREESELIRRFAAPAAVAPRTVKKDDAGPSPGVAAPDAAISGTPSGPKGVDSPLVNTLAPEVDAGPLSDSAAALAPVPGARHPADEHECPRCAEWIKVKAKVCRFCGHELLPAVGTDASAARGEVAIASPPATPSPRRVSSARLRAGTLRSEPSASRVALPARPQRRLIRAATLLAAGALALAIVVRVVELDPSGAPSTPTLPRSATGGAPGSVLDDGPGTTTIAPPRVRPSRAKRPVVNDEDDVARVLEDAAQFEAGGFEPLAAARFEEALEVPHTPKAAELIREARETLFSHCRTSIDAACADLQQCAVAGDMLGARMMLESLSYHVPEALLPYTRARVDKINEVLRAKWGEGLEGNPRDLARYLKARPEIDEALAKLNLADAGRVVDRLSGVNEDPLTISNLEFDRDRLKGVAKLTAQIGKGLEGLIGTDIDFALRAGGSVTGTLVRMGRDGFVLKLAGGGERIVGPGELSSKPLGELAHELDGDTRFGLAVVLACRGERRSALEILAVIEKDPRAERLRKELKQDEAPLVLSDRAAERQDTSRAASPPASTTRATPKGPSRRSPDWAKDASGAVAWEEAYAVETDHYILKTNVRRAHAARYAKFLEALAERFAQVFEFSGNDFSYKKNEVSLYATYDEYARHEAAVLGALPIKAAGFYEPTTKRLVTYQGPDPDTGADSTLTVLAHEATHQFENLVLRRMDHAPVFMIEGLAVFFQTPIIRENGDVVVGAIPVGALRSLQRSIRANDSIALRDVIRTPRASFGAVHYCHSWGIVHWLMYGPEKRRSQKLLDWYWQRCLEKPTAAEDFEDGLAQMGYTMDKLEASWREWILSLDPEKDPAITAYEERRRKN